MKNYDGDDLQGVDIPVSNDQYGAQPADIELARASNSLATRVASPVPVPTDEDALRNEAEGWLTIDVYQNAHEIVVESAVAGVNPEDLDITATPDSIVIKGERQRRKEVKDEDYLYRNAIGASSPAPSSFPRKWTP